MVEDKTNHKLYLGGAFTRVGANTGGGAPIDTDIGQPVVQAPLDRGIIPM